MPAASTPPTRILRVDLGLRDHLDAHAGGGRGHEDGLNGSRAREQHAGAESEREPSGRGGVDPATGPNGRCEKRTRAAYAVTGRRQAPDFVGQRPQRLDGLALLGALGLERFGHDLGQARAGVRNAALDDERVQLAHQLDAGLRARVGLAGERPPDHRPELLRESRNSAAELRNLLEQDLLQRLGLVDAGEQPPARGRFVQRGTQAKQIDAMVELAAQELLGRHVAELPLHAPQRRLSDATRRPRDAEVDQLDLTVVGDEDVLRADIAMHEAERGPVGALEGVSVTEPLGHPRPQPGDDTGLELLAATRQCAHQLRERLSVQVFHRQEQGVALAAELVNMNDVRVGEPHQQVGLVEELIDELALLGEVLVHHLDGDDSLETHRAREPSQVDSGASTHSQARPDHVAAEPRADAAAPRIEALGYCVFFQGFTAWGSSRCAARAPDPFDPMPARCRAARPCNGAARVDRARAA